MFLLGDYHYTWSDFIGNVGVAILIGTYLMLQIEKLDAKGFWYSFLNLCVAVLLFVNLMYKPNISAIVLEFFWALISLYGLYRWKRSKNQAIKKGL